MKLESIMFATRALVLCGSSIGILPAASNQSQVGKPFRVSDSVATYCSEGRSLAMCEAFKPLLAEFFAETRDAAWAGTIEPLIEKSMLVQGKPRAEIRALECRRTMCALEYAVFVDDLDHGVDGSEQLSRLMEPLGGVMAPELPGADGRGKIVSVLIWRKIAQLP